MTKHVVRLLLIVYVALIWTVPLLAGAVPVLLAPTLIARVLAVALMPAAMLLTFVVTAGGLSTITRRAIVAGRVRRDLGDPVYGPRRLYSICWTSVYYCTPVYHAILAIDPLKHLAFRLFGYRGALDITVQPDTWIRDLPLLDLGAQAYIANRATLGTNICTATGEIIVDRITVGARAVVGHLAMVGLGTEIGEEAEIGQGAIVGAKVRIGARARIGAGCGINHGVRIGNDCVIGAAATINARVVIADGIQIPFGAMIPVKTTIRTQAEADAYAPAVAPSRIRTSAPRRLSAA